MNNCPQHIIRMEAGHFTSILALARIRMLSNQYRSSYVARGFRP